MTPLLFALVDALEMSGWSGEYGLYRSWRRRARRCGDEAGFAIAHKRMAECKVFAVGEWRSLWGML